MASAAAPSSDKSPPPLPYTTLPASPRRRRAIGVDIIAVGQILAAIVLICCVPLSLPTIRADEALTLPVHWFFRMYLVAVLILPATLLVVSARKLFRRRTGSLKLMLAVYAALAVIVLVLLLLPEFI